MKKLAKNEGTASKPSVFAYYVVSFGNGETLGGPVYFRTLDGVLAAVAECLARGEFITVETEELQFSDSAVVK